MNLRKIAAITTGKIILGLTQFLKIGGGTAAPGFYALKIYPRLVEDLAKQIPQTVIITGTNGKTTTARILAHFLNSQNLRVIRNKTGSNLERGIASTLISCSHMSSGKILNVDLAIWELDEAAFNQVAPKLNPQTVIFLNAFRDQLDRYGEVDTVIKKWAQTLKKLPKKTAILINNDDHNLAQLKKGFSGRVLSFGLTENKIKGELSLFSTGSGKADYEARDIELEGLQGSKFGLNLNGEQWVFTLPLPGIYHIYDFLAALSCALELKLNPRFIIDSFKNFSPAFGRVEKFTLPNQKEGYILLIKNPTGATQVLQLLKNELKAEDRLLLALNDNLADGTDVSWIWDADFEQLSTIKYLPLTISSGTRAQDMALRLKYSGLDTKLLILDNNLNRAFQKAKEGLPGRLFILPTYTALLDLQRILVRKKIKKHYWKEA